MEYGLIILSVLLLWGLLGSGSSRGVPHFRNPPPPPKMKRKKLKKQTAWQDHFHSKK